MPTLSFWCLIYTDGRSPDALSLRGTEFALDRLETPPPLGEKTELLGPHAALAERELRTASAAFLLWGKREVQREAGDFFALATQAVVRAVRDLDGWGVDILRQWPFPLSEADALPDDPMAEDLFSVGLLDADGAYRAQTFGLSKLGQKEISFSFVGEHLVEEAVVLCARLAGYAMRQGRRVEGGQAMSFGFDQLTFVACGMESERLRPSFARQVVPARLFGEVGQLEVGDLSGVLQRAYEQRLVLEEHELDGVSPHQSEQARACACAGGERGLRGHRREPELARDSGWIFTCLQSHSPAELTVDTLESIAQRLPQVVRFLALPVGSSVEWHGERVTVDPGQLSGVDDDADDE